MSLNASCEEPTPVVEICGLSKKYPRTIRGSLKRGVLGLWRMLSSQRDDDTLASDEFWALQDINLTLCRGEIVGLVGHNGSGKSTLLRIVAGIGLPSTGIIRRTQRVLPLFGIPMLVSEQASLAEAAPIIAGLLGMDPEETVVSVSEILAAAGLSGREKTPLAMLSTGMQVRFCLSVAALFKPELLIVDEVTSALDAEFKRAVGRQIRGAGESGAVLIVSHDTSILRDICTRIVRLEGGRVVCDSADVAAAIDIYEADRAQLQDAQWL